MLPVILSGGSGTRLWPLSTPEVPKQFLPLIDKNETMIQQTANRLDGLDFISAPLVICNKKHLKLVQEQLGQIQKLKRPVMLEPIGRNTAPAIAAAAFYAQEHEEDGLMLVLASDHTIQNVKAFQKAVKAAKKAAGKNQYALFGIVPTRPETGYGYIETANSENGTAAFKVKSFREKPNLNTAKKYLAAKNYFWNSGMFVLPAKLFLQELEKFDSEMFSLTKKAYEKAKVTKEFIALQKASFEKIKGNSIDYAVMEHTQNAVVIPLDAGWSDVGSWDMVWELSEKDREGNANKSDKVKPFYADAFGNLIHTQKNRPVALLGIRDCVIIESPQGLLIANKSYMQEVKAAAESFKN